MLLQVCIVLCLVSQLRPTLCSPMDCSPPGSSVCGDSPVKNTGVGCHALLQGTSPTQGMNLGLPHCRQILYRLSHQGSPRITEWSAGTQMTKVKYLQSLPFLCTRLGEFYLNSLILPSFVFFQKFLAFVTKKEKKVVKGLSGGCQVKGKRVFSRNRQLEQDAWEQLWHVRTLDQKEKKIGYFKKDICGIYIEIS